MTSALKKVDVAVFSAINAAKDGKLKGGTNVTFGAKHQRRRLRQVELEGLRPSIKAAVAAQYKLLKAGKIKGIPATVK